MTDEDDFIRLIQFDLVDPEDSHTNGLVEDGDNE